MEKIYEFLKQCGVYFLATMDGDQARVRPFGTIDLYQGKLYIQTGKVKAVSQQMLANPKVELCAMNQETHNWLRITALAELEDNVDAQAHMLDAYPNLKKMYQPGDGNTQVFALTHGTATFSSFTEAPVTVTF